MYIAAFMPLTITGPTGGTRLEQSFEFAPGAKAQPARKTIVFHFCSWVRALDLSRPAGFAEADFSVSILAVGRRTYSSRCACSFASHPWGTSECVRRDGHEYSAGRWSKQRGPRLGCRIPEKWEMFYLLGGGCVECGNFQHNSDLH